MWLREPGMEESIFSRQLVNLNLLLKRDLDGKGREKSYNLSKSAFWGTGFHTFKIRLLSTFHGPGTGSGAFMGVVFYSQVSCEG